MPQKLIDQTTIQPDGRPGDDAFTAFATCNDNFQDAEARLVVLEAGGGETGDRLDNEIAARADADSALGALITQETADRISAVQSEAVARANADAAITARISGDNYLINGDMLLWQRNTVFGSEMNTRRYTADRWIVWTGGGKPSQVAQRSMHDAAWLPVLAQIRPKFAMYVAVGEAGTASDSFVLLQQNIEGVHVLAGGPVTVSLAIWVDKATKMGIGFWQSYDDGDNVVEVRPVNVSLVPGWQQVSATLTLPALSTTRPRGPRNCLNLNIWLAASNAANSAAPGVGLEGFTTWITNAKLEAGTSATGFRPQKESEVIAQCQRYYCKSYNLSTPPGSVTNEGRYTWGASSVANSNMRTVVPFPVRMRAAPSIVTYGAPSGVPGVISQANGDNVQGFVEAVGSGSFNAAWNTTGGQWGGWFQWVADAEI